MTNASPEAVHGRNASSEAWSFKKNVPLLNVVCLGERNVGKTSLLNRLCHNQYVDEYSPTPQAVVFGATLLKINEKDDKVKVRFLDSPGDRPLKRRTIDKMLDAANIVLLCFAVDSMYSLQSLQSFWDPALKAYCLRHNRLIPKILVELKNDLFENKALHPLIEVRMGDVDAAARAMKPQGYFDVSCKSADGIEDLYDAMVNISLGFHFKPTDMPSHVDAGVDENGEIMPGAVTFVDDENELIRERRRQAKEDEINEARKHAGLAERVDPGGVKIKDDEDGYVDKEGVWHGRKTKADFLESGETIVKMQMIDKNFELKEFEVEYENQTNATDELDHRIAELEQEVEADILATMVKDNLVSDELKARSSGGGWLDRTRRTQQRAKQLSISRASGAGAAVAYTDVQLLQIGDYELEDDDREEFWHMIRSGHLPMEKRERAIAAMVVESFMVRAINARARRRALAAAAAMKWRAVVEERQAKRLVQRILKRVSEKSACAIIPLLLLFQRIAPPRASILTINNEKDKAAMEHKVFEATSLEDDLTTSRLHSQARAKTKNAVYSRLQNVEARLDAMQSLLTDRLGILLKHADDDDSNSDISRQSSDAFIGMKPGDIIRNDNY